MIHFKTIDVIQKDKKTGCVLKFQFEHSYHSMKRGIQRCISNEQVSVVIAYGELIEKQGLQYYILGEDNIPEELRKEKDRFRNIVVVAKEGVVITSYRSKCPFRHIKKKSKTFYTQKLAA
jgi:hypothetical protein